MPPGTHLAAQRLTPARVGGAAWAVRSASGEAEMLRALGAAAGFVPQIASTYSDLRQISAAMGSGRLIRLADPLEFEPALVLRAIEHPAARRSLFLLWRPDSEAEPVADLVAEELRAARVPYVTDTAKWTAPGSQGARSAQRPPVDQVDRGGGRVQRPASADLDDW